MGISQVMKAFNEAGAGAFTADRAFLSYAHEHDVQMQVLRFVGAYADGRPLDVTRSCRPEASLELEARTHAEEIHAVEARPKALPAPEPVEARVETPVELPVEPTAIDAPLNDDWAWAECDEPSKTEPSAEAAAIPEEGVVQ